MPVALAYAVIAGTVLLAVGLVVAVLELVRRARRHRPARRHASNRPTWDSPAPRVEVAPFVEELDRTAERAAQRLEAAVNAERRAASMARHPSAVPSPRRELEALAALPTEELEAAIDRAVVDALGAGTVVDGTVGPTTALLPRLTYPPVINNTLTPDQGGHP